jgi:hypothetical protein
MRGGNRLGIQHQLRLLKGLCTLDLCDDDDVVGHDDAEKKFET